MLIMSPREISIVTEMYTPSKDEIRRAEEIVELANKATKENKGIIIHNGIFISPPSLKAAKKLLQKNKEIIKYEKYIN